MQKWTIGFGENWPYFLTSACVCVGLACVMTYSEVIYIYMYVQYIFIYDTWLFWCCSARFLRYFLVEQQTSCGFSSEAMIRDKWSSVKAKTCREKRSQPGMEVQKLKNQQKSTTWYSPCQVWMRIKNWTLQNWLQQIAGCPDKMWHD